MRWTLTVFAASACLLLATAAGEETRAPAEWVVRLGADHLADRDEASAALLALGSKAREDVCNALNSPDAEVQWRAQELWRTLRWLVVPDADADTRALIEEAEQKKESREHWRDFVKKHGAQSLRLVAVFYAEKYPGYQDAVYAIVEDGNPQEVAQVIAHAGKEKAALKTPIDDLELTPDRLPSITTVNLMQIEIALWNYKKAFDMGREAWLRHGVPALLKQCSVAVDRGNLFDEVNETALKEMAAETNNTLLCRNLSFYITLYASCGKQDHIVALCDAAPHLDMSQLHGIQLQELAESFLRANLPAYALKALRQPQDPLEMYLRSLAETQLHNAEAADADWKLVMTTLDPANKATKAQLFSLGEIMRQWHDPHAGLFFQRIVEITPPEPVYDANAYFRLGQIAEEEHEYRRAADLMEKGLGFAKLSGGIIIATDGDKNSKPGEEPILEIIKRLRTQAAGEKPVAVDQPSPEAVPEPSSP